MTGLEIALFILGAAFIIISFFIVDNGNSTGHTSGPSETSVTGEVLRRIGADTIEDLNHKSDLLIAESEDKLEAISNDKIIAVGEYSDQILEKINSNHKEVVFLYQMLNDKENELKATASKLDNVRIECEKLIKAEAELEAKRTAEAASVQTRPRTIQDPAQNAVYQEKRISSADAVPPTVRVSDTVIGEKAASDRNTAVRSGSTERTAATPASAGTVTTENAAAAASSGNAASAGSAASSATVTRRPAAVTNTAQGTTAGTTAQKTTANTTARRTAAATGSASTAAARTAAKKAPAPPAAPRPIEAEGRDNQSLSRNEEVLSLHRQGRSVMEISKLMGMGQGEVRLIINLYG